MILVFTPRITRRVQYIMRFMLEEIAGFQIALTEDAEKFNTWTGAKISYGTSGPPDALHFSSITLLQENGIFDHEVATTEWNGSRAFFPVRKNAVLPFDPFAAAFYLVTRYEEYLPHKKDRFDRYDAAESILSRESLNEKPVVDNWALEIRRVILERFPNEPYRQRKFTYTSTIDIDSAYAYLEKGLVRTIGALARSAMGLQFPQMLDRTQVLTGLKADPFDTYQWQLDMAQKYRIPLIYFVLVADYGYNNKNVSFMSGRFQNLIKSLADYGTIGIHPGFDSGRNQVMLRKEISRLEQIVNREINCSRHHFLRLSFPESYRYLQEAGITDDYSMGFAAQPGFRAGTCTPFQFYDLDLETETSLRVHPFAYMEGTFRDYLDMGPEASASAIGTLIEEVKKVNGHFVSLWHNDSLSETGRWVGWREVYEYSLNKGSS